MSSHNQAANYNASQAILRLTEADVKRKGSGTGSVRFRDGAWYYRFAEWRTNKDGEFGWFETERKIAIDGDHKKVKESRALLLGYEQYGSKAAEVNRAPQGLMNLEFYVDNVYLPAMEHGRVWAASKKSLIRCHVIPAFGKLCLNEVRRPMVQQWIQRLELSPQPKKHCLNVLRGIFNFAIDQEAVEGNPAERIRLPRMQYKERTAYTLDQIRQLAAKLRTSGKSEVNKNARFDGNFLARFALFLPLTGLRRGEALALRWRDVDLAGAKVITRGTYNLWEMTPGKSDAAIREIPLVTEAVAVLREQLTASKWTGEDHPVFADAKGKPFNAASALRRVVKPLAVKMGMVDFDWHSERHTTASALDGHATPDQRKELLGHSSVQMTGRYTHVQREQVRAAMEAALGVKPAETPPPAAVEEKQETIH